MFGGRSVAKPQVEDFGSVFGEWKVILGNLPTPTAPVHLVGLTTWCCRLWGFKNIVLFVCLFSEVKAVTTNFGEKGERCR